MTNIRNVNEIYHTDHEKPRKQQPLFYSLAAEKSASRPVYSAEKLVDEGLKVLKKDLAKSQKKDSVPFILPPPKVADRQINRLRERRENKSEKKSLAKVYETEKSDRKAKIPDSLIKLLTPFSPMLRWSPSLPVKPPQNKEIKMRDGEVFQSNKTLLIEETLWRDMEYSENRCCESPFSKYPDSKIEEEITLEEEFLTWLEESDSCEMDLGSTCQDQAFLLLAESSYNHNESSPFQEKEKWMEVKDELWASGNEMNFFESTDEESSAETEKITKQLDENELKESSSFEGEFSALLRKAYFILDEPLRDNNSLQEKFLELMEESSSYIHDLQVLLRKTHFSDKASIGSESKNDFESERYEKVSSLLETFSSMLKANNARSESELNNNDYLLNRKNEVDTEKLPKKETCSLGIESDFREELTEKLEETPGHCAGSESMEDEIHNSSFLGNCQIKNQKGPIVKLPILVARKELEFIICDSLPKLTGIHCTTDVEWSVESLHCMTNVPSNMAFIKGMLIAKIQYADDKSMHAIRLPIPIEKTIELSWLSLPMLPSPNIKKEYIFRKETDHEIHYEFSQNFYEEITCCLKSMKITWHVSMELDKTLEIQGSALLCVDFFQEQYMKL
ncbi:hypothetical protein [Bacillus sp. J33]|uniref:hypothetical protein n=1 Tax=Bacillus sp. J33 TaxID=935836 RepID=UPI00047D4485|nr:hypothetical protein [Bacillus sp. J33]